MFQLFVFLSNYHGQVSTQVIGFHSREWADQAQLQMSMNFGNSTVISEWTITKLYPEEE